MAQEKTLRLGIDSRAARQGARETVRSLDDVRRAANRTVDEIDAVEQELRGLSRAAESLNRVGRTMTMALTLPLAAIGGVAVKAAADMERLRMSLDTMTGSSAETAVQLERLRQVARAPGLGLREAVQGSVNLQAVGFAAEDAERALMAFGNAIATTGGGKAELDRVIDQLTQMAAAGRILTQDLRPIIQTAPTVSQALMNLFGTISAEEIEQLGLSFDEFFDTLVTELEKMPSVAGGAANSLENLSGAAFQASAALGDQLLPAVLPLIEGAANLLEQVEELDPETVRWGIAIGAVAAAAGPAALVLGSLVSAATGLAVALGVGGIGLLGIIGVGGPLLAGLGALSAEWVKNKLDALAAAGAVDDLSASLQGLSQEQKILATANLFKRIDALRDMPQTEWVRGEITSLEERASALAEAFNAAQSSGMDEIAESSRNAAEAVAEVTLTIRDLERALRGLPDASMSVPGTLDPFSALVQRRRARQAEIDRMTGRFIDAGGRLTPVTTYGGQGGEGLEGDAAREFAHAMQAVNEVTSAFGDMADALDALSPALSDALRGIEDMASGAARFRQGQNMSGLLGTLGMASGALSMAAGLMQVGQSLFGESEAEKQRNRLIAQNNEALEKLRRSFDGFGARGDMIRGIGVIDSIGDEGRGTRDRRAFLEALAPHREFLELLAAEQGVQLFDGNSYISGSLQALEDALRMVTDRLFEFGDSLDQQKSQLSAMLEIWDLDSPGDALRGQVSLLEQFAPELMRQFGLANLNTGSEAGRAVLETGLRDIFTAYVTGSLDKDLLNRFASGQEFIDLLLGADRALDAFAEGLNDAANAVTDIPKAVNLALYRQRYGTGAPSSGGGGSSAWPTFPNAPIEVSGPQDFPGGRYPSFEVHGNIIIENNAGDSPESLVAKIEQGVRDRYGRGAPTHLPGVRTTP